MTYYTDELYHGTYPVYSDELYHYGVKGMKWGVRRGPKKGSRVYNAYNKKQDARKAYHESILNRDDKKTRKSNRAAYRTASKAYRKKLNERNPNYTTKQRMHDEFMYGVFANGINKNMNKGYTHKQAVRKARHKALLGETAVLGGTLGALAAPGAVNKFKNRPVNMRKNKNGQWQKRRW